MPQGLPKMEKNCTGFARFGFPIPCITEEIATGADRVGNDNLREQRTDRLSLRKQSQGS
jgi:hypothetical protein